MTSSPYSWLSTKSYKQVEINDLFKYDEYIEAFKSHFSYNLPKHSSSEYTDTITIDKMVVHFCFGQIFRTSSSIICNRHGCTYK